jgi:predicted P-loop ATPase
LSVDPGTFIQFSKASHLRSTSWGNHALALRELLDWVTKLRPGDKADGEVWAPATMKGKRRLAASADGTDLAVFDSDAGHTLAEIRAAFERLGWYARIIPSSSWGRTDTEASEDHYNAWVAEQPDGQAEDLPERYLVEQLRKVPAVAAGATVLNRFTEIVKTSNGDQVRRLIRFRHGPCEKYRIICVLVKRYDLGTGPARRAWKRHYDAMIDQIGLPLDRSTGSPERLFFLSYLSPDRLKGARGHQAEVRGGFIDVAALPEPKPRERTRRGGFRTFKEDEVRGRGSDDEPLSYVWHDPDTGDDLDLHVLAARGLFQHLELADALADNGWAQDDRGVVEGKHHIECPFNAEHTKQLDGGTICWNASDHHRTGMSDLQMGAGITCNHHSCQGRDRLEFVVELLRRGGLTTADIRNAQAVAKDKSLAEDFEPVDPDLVILKALVKPSMDWDQAQVMAHAPALRRLKREAPARFEEAAEGWAMLGTIDRDDLDLLIEVSPDEKDDPDPPKGGKGGSGDRHWRDKLHHNKDGTPAATTSNIALAIEQGLGLGNGVVAYNRLKSRLDIRDPSRLPWAGKGEEPRAWTDNDDTEAAIRLDQLLGGQVIRPHTVTPIIETIGRRHAYHPVQDYLNGLKWDGVPRLDRLLVDYGEAEDTPFNRAAVARTLIAACARAMKPGCKVDTALILESTQGVKKSTLFSALAGNPEYFHDSTGVMGDKGSAEIVGAHWVLEMAELAGMTKVDLNHVKAFLSRQVDKYRPAYARRVVDFPRQCIVVGTVNGQVTGYLKDLTGNRRFWIVRVGKIDWLYIDENRDQLWAEAKARYDAGERWWFDDEEEQHLITEQQDAASQRTAEPELVDTLRNFIKEKPGASGHDRDFSDGWVPRAHPLTVIPSPITFWNAIGTPTRDITFSKKVSFNQALQALGWEVRQVWETKAHPLGLERGARFYVSPEGAVAHREGRLHTWLEDQVRIGAVAGMLTPQESSQNVIVLDERKRSDEKKKKSDEKKSDEPKEKP